MIFWNNTTKHGIDIKLSKNEYVLGEQIKGVLVFNANKTFIAKKMTFYLRRREEASMSISKTYYNSGNPEPHEETLSSYADSVIVNLNDKLDKINKKLLADGSIEISKQGTIEIPFEFSVSPNYPESDKGKKEKISIT